MFTPLLTEIPPHVMTMNKLEMMQLEFSKQTDNIMSRFGKELDDRNAGGAKHGLKRTFLKSKKCFQSF